MKPEDLPHRFCPQCAKSLVPLAVPHLSSKCDSCGRMSYYLRQPGESGIRVDQGERLTIPDGYIKLSLIPGARGKLFRPGLSLLIHQLFLTPRPESADAIASFAADLSVNADEILGKSPLLKGLNIHSKDDEAAITKTIKDHPRSREMYASAMGAFSHEVGEAVEEGSASRAAWAGYLLGTYRALTIVAEPVFEQTLWRGYLANDVVYEAAAAASRTPAESEAIRKVAPLFQKLDELTLHAWVDSKLPIGPRIGVKGLPEEILSALARWHLTAFQRSREDQLRAASERRAVLELRLKWLTAGIVIASTIFTGLRLLFGG